MIARVLRRAERIVTGVALGMRVVSGVIIVVMMVTTAYDVVMRYLFASPTEWALTLNAAAVLASTFLAVPHLAAVGGHIQMDLLYRRLGERARLAADVLTGIATVVVAGSFAWLGYRATMSAYVNGLMTSGNFSLPLWSVYVFIYLGGLVLLLVVLLAPWRADEAGG
ncbi:MAG: TRAP transporter small permease subunit [Streptosporangiales bacterium]|nr:TRAP transporter small permease subunit [Streptosporangiales bacterium]